MSDFKTCMFSLLVNGTAILLFHPPLCHAADSATAEAVATATVSQAVAVPLKADALAPDPQPEVRDLADPDEGVDAASKAMTAAVADGVTTGLALSAGAVEANPLVSPTPLGLIALTTGKVLLVKYAEKLPEQEKRMVMKTSSAAWGGAAVNNLMVLMAAPPPLPILAALLMGLLTWKHMQDQYDTGDRLLAARSGKPAAPPPEQALPLLAQGH